MYKGARLNTPDYHLAEAGKEELVGLTMSVILPELVAGRKASAVKDLVISILSHEWPLTSKSIHKRIVRLYSVECSYQAVYKQLQEMVGKGILRKQGRHYLISERWLNQLSYFSSKLKEQYLKESNVLIPFEDFLDEEQGKLAKPNQYQKKLEEVLGKNINLRREKKQSSLAEF